MGKGDELFQAFVVEIGVGDLVQVLSSESRQGPRRQGFEGEGNLASAQLHGDLLSGDGNDFALYAVAVALRDGAFGSREVLDKLCHQLIGCGPEMQVVGNTCHAFRRWK